MDDDLTRRLWRRLSSANASQWRATISDFRDAYSITACDRAIEDLALLGLVTIRYAPEFGLEVDHVGRSDTSTSFDSFPSEATLRLLRMICHLAPPEVLLHPASLSRAGVEEHAVGELGIESGAFDTCLHELSYLGLVTVWETFRDDYGRETLSLTRPCGLSLLSVLRAFGARRMSERGHVFISYVHDDEQAVVQLQNALEAAALPVWRDADRIRLGSRWRQTISRATGASSVAFVACFSSASESRERSYMREELVRAVDELRLRSPESRGSFPSSSRPVSCRIFQSAADSHFTISNGWISPRTGNGVSEPLSRR
jgi:hypothetical protein